MIGVAFSAFLVLIASARIAMAAPLTWDWQLSQPFDLSRSVAWLDIDPDNQSPAELAAIQAQGIKTICYVSVGTIEDYRDDIADFPAEVVGNVYGDWPDEKFLDVRRLDIVLPLMTARFKRCADLGFEAVEPDNIDVYTNDSGFAISEKDAVAYILALAEVAHGLGMHIGQKNAPELTAKLVGALDLVITEDCHMDGWCAEVIGYADAGKPVFAAEYSDTDVDFAEACAWGATRGFSFILKDRDLTQSFEACP